MSTSIEKLRKLVLRMLLDDVVSDTSLRFARALVKKDTDLAHELCSGQVNPERESSELVENLKNKITEVESEKQKFFTESEKASDLFLDLSNLLADFDSKYLSKLKKSFSKYSSVNFSEFLEKPNVTKIVIDVKHNWFERLMIIIFNKNPETLPAYFADQLKLSEQLEKETKSTSEELVSLLDKKSTLEDLAYLQTILVQTIEPKSVKVKEAELLSKLTKKEDAFKADVASELDMFEKIVANKKAEVEAIKAEADKESKKLEEIRSRINKVNLKLKSVEDKISPYDRMSLNADALEKLLENVRETGKVNNDSGTKVDEKLELLIEMMFVTLGSSTTYDGSSTYYAGTDDLLSSVKSFKKKIQNI